MKLPLYLRGLLLMTVLVCAWMFWQDPQDNPATVPTPSAALTPASAPMPAPVVAAESRDVVDIFPAQTWLPPPPPPVPASNQAVAPPSLPFTVSAQWRFQNQAKIVVLQGNGSQYTLCNHCTVPGRIKPGGMLGKDYRLESLTDTRVVLTYLPLKHASTLRLDAR